MTTNENEKNYETVNLELLLTELNKLQSEQKEEQTKANTLKAQIAEIAKQWQALSREHTELERTLAAKNNATRELEKKIDSARRLELVKAEQKRLQEEFEEKAKELDSITASAAWREFAYDHQIDGAKRLAVANRGICADKRGLGKTLTSLVWADMTKARKVIVFAPNDVVPQFEDEIRQWAPARTIFSLRGMPKEQRNFVYPMLDLLDEYVVTLNYEAWRRDKTIVDDLVKAGVDTLICDEAHRIKSSDKQTARGIFQIAYRPNFCPSCNKANNYLGSWMTSGGMLKDYEPSPMWCCQTCGTTLENTVKNVLCMTGTPMLNKPQELFSMLYLVDRFKFPAESKFLYDYCYKYAPNKWRFLPGGIDRLTKFMSDFFIARTREDAGIHIPPPAITVHELLKDKTNYKEQYEAERTITQQAALLLKDGTRKDIFFILELILRERQCMTWPAGIKITDPETKEVLCNFDVEESQKMDAALELLTELCEEEERVIVFSQFVKPLEVMHSRMSDLGFKSTLAIGGQSETHKSMVRNDFDLKYQDPDRGYRWQVCFATYKAFGVGVNLNAARHMILLDDEWNPGMEDQAIGRIDRMNSVDQANVHIFRVKDSIDDFMAAILREKAGIIGDFEESTESQFDRLKRFFED